MRITKQKALKNARKAIEYMRAEKIPMPNKSRISEHLQRSQ